MHSMSVNDEELRVLLDSVEAAYRHQHRENWEVHEAAPADADPEIANKAEQRLSILDGVLRKLGSSGDVALRRQPSLRK